jgi:hypothetical protein
MQETGNWVGGIKDVEVEHTLCWYHVCKRIDEGLGAVGLAQEKRKEFRLRLKMQVTFFSGNFNGLEYNRQSTGNDRAISRNRKVAVVTDTDRCFMVQCQLWVIVVLAQIVPVSRTLG